MSTSKKLTATQINALAKKTVDNNLIIAISFP